MKNRDSNENIYRHLEKCYALLQVHILFSFHTLLYILLITHCKVRKIIGEFQRKSEKIREFRGKSGNFRGKYVENRGISEESIPRSGRTEGRSCGRFRSFSLVIRSFFRSFPVIFRLIPENHSFSFLFIPSPPQITPILCSKTYSLQILLKFLAFFLAVPNILLTFANGYKTIVNYPARRPLSPMAS